MAMPAAPDKSATKTDSQTATKRATLIAIVPHMHRDAPMTHQLFGQWLRQARRALDLTQEALAERVACAATTIRTFESGARRPSRAMAERLADVLAIPPGDRAAFLQLARARPADRASAAAGSPPANVVAIRPSVTQRDAKRLPRLLTSFIGRQ